MKRSPSLNPVSQLWGERRGYSSQLEQVRNKRCGSQEHAKEREDSKCCLKLAFSSYHNGFISTPLLQLRLERGYNQSF